MSAPTAAGVWRQVDKSGKVGALVTISQEGNAFVGRLSRLFLDPRDDPNPICENCPGDKHNQPFLGLAFIEGMKQSGLDYTGGTVLDPKTGKIYNAKMSLSPDGKRLTLRGYIGLSIFGRSQTWTRVRVTQVHRYAAGTRIGSYWPHCSSGSGKISLEPVSAERASSTPH